MILAATAAVAHADKPIPTGSVLRSATETPSAPDGVPDSQIDVDVSGAESWDGLGDPSNEVRLIQVGANALITGVGWDVIINSITITEE